MNAEDLYQAKLTKLTKKTKGNIPHIILKN